MYNISEDSVVTASNDQVSGEVTDGETVVLNLKNGVYYGLNTVGSRILELIREPRSVRDIRDILLQEYEVEPEVCTQELTAILNEMAGEELIKIT